MLIVVVVVHGEDPPPNEYVKCLVDRSLIVGTGIILDLDIVLIVLVSTTNGHVSSPFLKVVLIIFINMNRQSR